MGKAFAKLSLAFTIAAAVGGCNSAKNQYICRARQAEAQASLKGVHASEIAYKAKNAKFGSSLADIGFTPVGSRYYDVKVDSASDTAYAATATGKDQSAGDVWTIDQTGTPVAKTDKCHH
jgi:hypothetical protein